MADFNEPYTRSGSGRHLYPRVYSKRWAICSPHSKSCNISPRSCCPGTVCRCNLWGQNCRQGGQFQVYNIIIDYLTFYPERNTCFYLQMPQAQCVGPMAGLDGRVFGIVQFYVWNKIQLIFIFIYNLSLSTIIWCIWCKCCVWCIQCKSKMY